MLSDGATPEEGRIVAEHFGSHRRLTEAGVVLMAGRTQTTDYSTFGIVVFCAESEAAAHELVAGDPAVMHRVMRARLHPYGTALRGDVRGG